MRATQANPTFLRTALAAGVLFLLLVIFPQSARGESVAASFVEVTSTHLLFPFSTSEEREALVVMAKGTAGEIYYTVTQAGEAVEKILLLLTGENVGKELTSPPILPSLTGKNLLISTILFLPFLFSFFFTQAQTIPFFFLIFLPILKIPIPEFLRNAGTTIGFVGVCPAASTP